jgi:TRAP-type uncharacterized transport system fused permease subunit
MTAFAAAAIGKADYMRTGWESMWVAKALYIMPFLLVYSGILLWNRPVEMLFDFMAAFFGFALMPTVMEGYFLRRISIVERIVLAIATILFLISTFSFGFWGFLWLISGGVVVGAEVLYQKMTPQAVVKSA